MLAPQLSLLQAELTAQLLLLLPLALPPTAQGDSHVLSLMNPQAVNGTKDSCWDAHIEDACTHGCTILGGLLAMAMCCFAVKWHRCDSMVVKQGCVSTSPW